MIGLDWFDIIGGRDLSERLTVTMLHFLWQGAIVGVMVAALGWCVRNQSAQARYALYLAGLFVLATCVPVTYAFVGGSIVESDHAPAAARLGGP